MSSIDADVNIILNAQDNASDTVNDAARRINRSYLDMRRQQRAVGQAFELNNRIFFQTARAVQTIGNMANRAVGLFQAWNIQQIRNADAARDVREAQRNLNDAIAEFGPNSKQAIEAQEDLADAMARQKQAQIDTIANYITMGVVIAGMASSIITKAIPALAKLRAMIRATSAVGGASTIISPAFPNTGAKTTPKTSAGGRFGNFGRFVKPGLIGGGIAAGVTLASMLGEQQAGETEIPTGFDAIADISKDIKNQINQTFNFFSTTSQDLVKQVQEAAKKYATFG